MGLDSNVSGGTGSPRYVAVNIDGPSVLSAHLTDVSGGTVQVCLIRQDKQERRICNGRSGNGPAQTTVTDTGSSVWAVQVSSRDGNAPTATLIVDFNAMSPTATLTSFRYVGTQDPSRNGFVVQVDCFADGQLQINGSFDSDPQNYHLVIKPTDGGPIYDQTDGPSQAFSTMVAASNQTSYQITLSAPDATTTNSATAFVRASISWP